ncbi:MAG: DNA recombination protein RmuC [Pseudomonadales bacterium]|nr:DNA recombination protein RmuC [Pseudomonadales bacterium]
MAVGLWSGEMIAISVMIFIVGVVLGAGASGVVLVLRSSRQRAALEARLHDLQVDVSRWEERMSAANASEARLVKELEDSRRQINVAHQQLSDVRREQTQLQTVMDEREASHARELVTFEQQKEKLVEQFKLLSADILEAKSKSLQESSRVTLNAIMNPFQQSMDNFKKEVQEIHHRETTQQGELRKELEQLKELNQRITTEAHELSTALRGQKKLQGNWGELVLENVLDRSGLQLGKDYQREVSIATEEGRRRPDVVVYLPQKKHLVIDAKVSLNAYARFVNADDDGARALALKEHVQAIADRIAELASRDYYKLPGLNSPAMVFMFIPIESAFVEALKANEALFQQAIDNNVLVATPTTLLTSLNIVRQLWRYEEQNKHTAALASKADAVFKKLNTFLGSFEGIKQGLDNAAEAYNKAEGQLLGGKGNLVKQVSDFKQLAPAIKGELPEYFVEKAALEIDWVTPEQPVPQGDGSPTLVSSS